jgi:mRNA-degrading endonuclease RelE of RelBE toxin-antitoxin system
MAFRIELTQSAFDDLDRFKKRERNIILDGIEKQLTGEPQRETRNRKPLRENPLSHWELRLGQYRVFYDVSVAEQRVKVIAVGYKLHNKLFIGGAEFEL